MKPLLTKSKYINGVQCPAFLWLEINTPEKIPEPNAPTLHRMEEGTKVGEFATKLYSEGIAVPTKDFNENLAQTQILLKKRKPLFEPGFKFSTPDGDTYARIDLLVPAEEDRWDILEVKSGTKVKPINVHDVAFQKYVCEKSGLKIRKCILCHVNNEFVKNGEIKPENFFVAEDVCEEVDELYGGVENNIKRFFEVVKLKECPKVTPEDILTAEYSNVAIDEFYDSLPEDNVFEMIGWGPKKGIKIYQEGMIKIEDVPENFKMNEKQKIQRKCVIDGKCHSDKEKIKEFLEGLKYPLYYLDFETFNEVIPRFEGAKPYQQIPFQFSLHVVKKKGDKPEHISFLADGGGDPRLEFLEKLKESLGSEGDVVVYNEGFEKRIIKECIDTFPEFKEWGNGILNRIVDLLHPFKNFHFYHPNQKGSASIKKVLPIFSKDVDYDDLVIGNGEDASISYLKSHFEDTPAEEKAKIREHLERYCELDTWAEIVLVEGLREIVDGK